MTVSASIRLPYRASLYDIYQSIEANRSTEKAYDQFAEQVGNLKAWQTLTPNDRPSRKLKRIVRGSERLHKAGASEIDFAPPTLPLVICASYSTEFISQLKSILELANSSRANAQQLTALIAERFDLVERHSIVVERARMSIRDLRRPFVKLLSGHAYTLERNIDGQRRFVHLVEVDIKKRDVEYIVVPDRVYVPNQQIDLAIIERRRSQRRMHHWKNDWKRRVNSAHELEWAIAERFYRQTKTGRWRLRFVAPKAITIELTSLLTGISTRTFETAIANQTIPPTGTK